jgi:hypothetical protein
MVEVDQRQMTDPTARQGFSRPRSNSTKPNDHDMSAAQTFEGVIAEQPPDRRKTPVGQGSNTVQPVVRRDSRSVWACWISASGRR